MRVSSSIRVIEGDSASSLDLTLRPLMAYLARAEVTELCVNRPGELFLETDKGWESISVPFADFDWCLRLARLIAHYTRQRVDTENPLLSATLPSGERVQIAIPPATMQNHVALTIRRPSQKSWSLLELAESGIFRVTQPSRAMLDETELQLQRLHADRRYEEFMRLAVVSRKNIVVSGPTGSGKTTYTKALIREIPTSERLITIEDAQELVLDRHPNHVRLFYSKDDQGQASVTPRQLLESCLRMKPDRILLAELRADEAFDYLRNVNSGHPGSITSVHASSAELAFEQLVLLVKQCPAGREFSRDEIKALLYLLVDIVIQFGIDGHERYVKEIWYEPTRRRDGLAALT